MNKQCCGGLGEFGKCGRGTKKGCKGLHCRCMGQNCSEMHYVDCFEHYIHVEHSPAPASKDWPVCPECQFELRPGSPQPHQSGCSHASTTDWREEFDATVKNKMRMNNDTLFRNEIPWIGAFIEKTVAAAEERGYKKGVGFPIEKLKNIYWEESRAAALQEVMALVEGMKEPLGKLASSVTWNAALDQVLASLQDKK